MWEIPLDMFVLKVLAQQPNRLLKSEAMIGQLLRDGVLEQLQELHLFANTRCLGELRGFFPA